MRDVFGGGVTIVYYERRESEINIQRQSNKNKRRINIQMVARNGSKKGIINIQVKVKSEARDRLYIFGEQGDERLRKCVTENQFWANNKDL